MAASLQEQAPPKVGSAKVCESRVNHGGPPQLGFPTGQRIAKAAARSECRRTRGQYTEVRKMVRGNLEQFGWVLKPMHLVENYPLTLKAL